MRHCPKRAGTGAAIVVLLAFLPMITATPALGAAGSQSEAASAQSVPAGVRQLITVTAARRRATYAKLSVFRRARVGYHGIAKPGAKREGDGRTPAGTYALGFFFGVLRDPGVSFPYRRARSYDFWDDDPSSPRYNEWVDRRHHDPGRSPEPMDRRPAYDYAAVIRYNTASVPGLGSAIYLLVGTGSATAGCVSLPRRKLLAILRWLRPRLSPRITIRVAAG